LLILIKCRKGSHIFVLMKKGTISLIIGLMSFALIGLIVFQAYWINNAVNLSKDQFKKDVYLALTDVSEKLEKTEILYTTAKKLQIAGKDQSFVSLDSITFYRKASAGDSLMSSLDAESRLQAIFEDEDTIKFLVGDEIVTLENSRMDLATPGINQALTSEDIGIEIKRFKATIDSIERFDEVLKKNINKVVEKSQMITVVLNELFTRERPIGSRVQLSLVDSMLEQAFINRGIQLPYQFGVYDTNRDTLLVNKEGANKAFIKASDLKINLFPNDLLNNINYLLVYFPDERTYVFQRIWGTLLTSIILILVIMFCFGFAIFTILRQKKLSEIKNDFINNMTHEFKTPISTVSLATQALQDSELSKSPDFVNRYVKIIAEENDRLGHQVEKVLQMATLDKRDFNLKKEEISVHRTIDKAIDAIRLQLEKLEGNLTLQLEASEDHVVADEVHLTNILYNLLDNAIKYSNGKPVISVSTTNIGEKLKIRIADKGIGMSKEAQAKIFDRFYRVPTGNLHDVKGFGLGLAYVKSMVEAHEGNINVQSEVGNGSSFDILLTTSHG